MPAILLGKTMDPDDVASKRRVAMWIVAQVLNRAKAAKRRGAWGGIVRFYKN